ncbi:RING/U-box superfamily protein [Striga asiatica]|uniref:RING/U-box superfamily protein n=1 Tax=Striga asiatica TaxID=4170 RepID=A0A5A7PQ83_STRAF|nr:RING/U-box superfamily protein [Striga asiatica]
MVTWSFSFLTTVVMDPAFHKFIQQLWKLETLNGIKEWIIEWLIKQQVGEDGMQVIAILVWYIRFLLELADSEKSSRIHLKLTPKARCFCESMFVVTCAVMTHRIQDLYILIAKFCACFHIIPLVNLIGANDNFGFVDCFKALLLEVGLCIGKQYCADYAPLVIAIVLILALYLKD